MNIFLTGYRCTGKTTVGKKLAYLLNRNFIDADQFLVNTCKNTISEIVETEGWESFRKKESEILKILCKLKQHVIATGGGVILDHNNVKIMKNNSVVIWLRATPETIRERIVKDETTKNSRPSLTSKGLLEEIEETLEFRNPLYKESMDFFVDTDNLKIDDICNTIINKIEKIKD